MLLYKIYKKIFFCSLLFPSPVFAKSKIVFKRVSHDNKKTIQKYIAHGYGPAQNYLKKVKGTVEIHTTKNARYSYASVQYRKLKTIYVINCSTKHLQNNKPITKFVIWHEIGHVIDFAGLNSKADQKFYKIFQKSKNWKSCFLYAQKKCVPKAEIFAD